ncbi:MAG: CPBP family intramembrane metalloprotease, partial [Muribaculaceae bacterium]|nr:CPBP family intramembrane metalloprotease [Muribaculaceae bacterium]
SEERARALTATLMGGGSVMDLIMGLLVVGVLAGVSEELFFRGALQRLLMTRPMNPHVAIWITAVIFSVFHFQFFGFFPRMLLGAFLGYAAWWSGSLWVPVVVHALNNMLVVLASWLKETGYSTVDFDSVGACGSVADVVLVGASVVLCGCGIVILRRISLRRD